MRFSFFVGAVVLLLFVACTSIQIERGLSAAIRLPGTPTRQDFSANVRQSWSEQANFLNSVDPYPADTVHRDLTRLLVTYAMYREGTARGYNSLEALFHAREVAEVVAQANYDVDRNLEDVSSRGDTLHWRNHREARILTEAAIASADPWRFGRASHAVQDYYTHFCSGFTGYGGKKGVDDYVQRSRPPFEDLETITGIPLKFIPAQPSRIFGDMNRRAAWYGHGFLYSDEYDPSDLTDSIMRHEYLHYCTLFAASWWERLEAQEDGLIGAR